MKKRIGVVLMAMTSAVALTGLAQADTFVLSGNIIDVGVSESGGLCDDSETAGIIYKPKSIDYLDGAAWFLEFYSMERAAIGIRRDMKTATLSGRRPPIPRLALPCRLRRSPTILP